MLSKIHSFINYFIFSNLFISISAGIISSGLSSFLGYSQFFEIGLFEFSSTLCIYTFQRLIKSRIEEKKEGELHLWIEKNVKIQWTYIAVTALISIYIYFYQLNAFENTKWWMIIALIVSLMYAVNINGISLRDLPFLKIYVIAIIWCNALMFPLFLNQDFNFSSILFVISHFFFIIAICIPFDIRDIHFDNPKMKTIPQKVGIENAKKWSLIALLIFNIITFVSKPQLISNHFFIVSLILTYYLLIKANVNSKSYFFYIFIDGTIMLFGLSYYFN